jgi:hypothetical protein
MFRQRFDAKANPSARHSFIYIVADIEWSIITTEFSTYHSRIESVSIGNIR